MDGPMYDRILIPTDGSAVADAAAEAAIALGQRFDAEPHVITVLERRDLPLRFEDADDLAHRGERAITAAVEMATDAGVTTTSAMIEDNVPTHRAILNYADTHDVDCIVLGTHGRTGLNRFILGSVAEQTLRESPVPVMTVHEGTILDPNFDAVLVPTDGSACAQAAADNAIELTLATDAALHIVHVVDLGVVWDDITPDMVLDALDEAGERALELVIDQAEDAGVSTIEASTLSGTPHRAIVEYATEHDVDCIVMGTHGRTGVDPRLLGSVTERVVRLTDRPVLALKERETTD